MKCNNCGAELPEGEKFCAVCGQQTESGESTKQQAAMSCPRKSQRNPADSKSVLWR